MKKFNWFSEITKSALRAMLGVIFVYLIYRAGIITPIKTILISTFLVYWMADLILEYFEQKNGRD